MGKLLLILITVPLIETWFLIRLGGFIGALPTIALVVFTAVLGGHLVRQQGLRTLQKAQTEMQAGGAPAIEMLEGVMILVAGVLLLTPGFFTDAFGFLCLFPPFRRAVIAKMIKSGMLQNASTMSWQTSAHGSHGFGQPADEGSVFEGEYRVHPDDDKRQGDERLSNKP